jgi:D-alanine--poly(phosphoribitol) ligase subunit 1
VNCLHSALLRKFEDCADSKAIERKDGSSLTYSQLLHSVCSLQKQITSSHEGKVKSVGILSTRKVESYIAVLSCYLWSIKFVPMNPELPIDRLQKIISSGCVDIVLCDSSSADIARQLNAPTIVMQADALQAECGGIAQPPRTPVLSQDAIAYQMFTSGSTGEPKGVPISSSSLAHYVFETVTVTGIPNGARFSQTFDLSFDLAMHDIFIALYCGGTILPAEGIELLMPNLYIEKRKIEVWFSVPMLALQAHRGKNGKPVSHRLKMAMFCGEPLPSDYADKFMGFMERDAPIYNLYGPTEATIAFTCKRYDPRQVLLPVVPLGAGYGQNVIAVELENGVVVPPTEGVEGELLLGGPQVFSGYDPANSSDIFIEVGGQQFYRSGDLVRYKKGELHHLGRRDSQIKLRGYRIELGDIEACFRKVFAINVATAVLLGEGDKREIAIAYEAEVEIVDFVSLKKALPSYMRPNHFIRLEKMPTNINGKIDRKALTQLPWNQ